MQRKLSSFDIHVVVDDLQGLIGCVIEKIYQLSPSELLIRVKDISKKEKKQLYIKNGELICCTKKQINTPTKPTTFAMTFRKYLQNGRIKEIKQHEFDRIIKISIGKKDGDYKIVFEFFSEGNIILVDPNGNIILPLIRQAWAHRKLKGREQYIPPPPQINPLDLEYNKFKELIKESNADIVRTLAVNLNLSGIIAEEICYRAEIEKKQKIDKIGEESLKILYNNFSKFIEIFKDKKYNPVIVIKDDEIVDILPIKFKSYKDVDFKDVESINAGFEKFIVNNKSEKKIERKKDEETGRLDRQLKQQKDTVKKLREKIDIKKKEGDLIYLNYQKLEELIEEIKKTLELKDKEEKIKKINQIDIVKKFTPTQNLLIVKLNDEKDNTTEVKINFRKSVSENAEQAYNDNKKYKSKLNGAQRSIKKTIEKINLSKEKFKEKEDEELKREDNSEKKFWFERFHWFISPEGNIVIAGRDAKSNEHIVKKYLNKGDRYAHADIQGAPSVVIKNKNLNEEKIEISEQTLEEACIFASSYSKAWKQFAEAQAYWVLPEQVSKSPRSGEFVPKGAFIIRGKRNYFRCKLELALGKVEILGDKKIMAGPVESIKKRTNEYIIIQPGAIKKSDISKKIAKAFQVNSSIIDRLLPAGGINIVKSVGVDI